MGRREGKLGGRFFFCFVLFVCLVSFSHGVIPGVLTSQNRDFFSLIISSAKTRNF